jgi:hypothetical protein
VGEYRGYIPGNIRDRWGNWRKYGEIWRNKGIYIYGKLWGNMGKILLATYIYGKLWENMGKIILAT